ncbi:DUF3631 domain-containing protein [Nocardia terpenica]|uniref:DUF3631 domain-containing protein n=1 Tax=Nocardia terpenica TaxID=455432 RepID=UPI00030A59DC|nr:DUF3631 domain-containing protein [Nocardia terpenica]NQE88636.1 DUF3631 domain-containing protein [Nocardia terpenica]NQE88647.1 DUF3631 domain-containing protein [Nocardia terpenica]
MSEPVDYANAHVAPLDGAVVLDQVRELICRYCVLPSQSALDGVVLWVAATHLVSGFEYAPRLVVRSAEKRSGKSRLLEVVDGLVYNPLRTVNASVAYVFRSLDADPPPTLLFDEADTIFGSKKVAENNEELRGLLNAGFQRGMTYGRVSGPNHEPTEFNTYAMAALAGIGRMPDTIEDRAVVVVMRRRKDSEKVKPFRGTRDRPALHSARDGLAQWADQVREPITGYEPADLGVEDRAADVWEPLIAVADMAGGHWPHTARTAAAEMVSAAEDDNDTTSPNMKLLADIRDVFAVTGLSFIKSQALCDQLRAVEESPWEDWELNPSKLGHRLKAYEIKTGHNPDKTERGYRRVDFLDAFDRYLPPRPQKPSEPVQAVHHSHDQREHSDTFPGTDMSATAEASEDSRRSTLAQAAPDGSGRVSGNHGYLPRTPGAKVGYWIGSGQPVTPDAA